MKFFILPLLAALNNYTPTDDTWKDGMEVTYNMTYKSDAAISNFEKVKKNEAPKHISHRLTPQMKCQLNPEHPELMHCHLTNPKLNQKLEFLNGTVVENHLNKRTELWDYFYGTYYLIDIKFNKTGIEEVKVADDMDGIFDEMRTMVYPLHTGLDMDNITPGNHENLDSFMPGNCPINYEVMMLKEQIGEPQATPEGKWEDGKQIIINKHRDMDKCPITVERYDSPNFRVWAASSGKINMEIKLSESHIAADNKRFISMNKFEGMAKVDDDKSIIFNEEVTLEYDSVAPVKTKIEDIPDPESIGLMLGNNTGVGEF